MIRKISASLLFIALVACNQFKTSKGKWTKHGIHGRVQEMSTKTYSVISKDGKEEADEAKQIFYENNTFDSSGNILESHVKKLNRYYISIYKKNSNDLLYTLNPLIGIFGGIDTLIYTGSQPDSIISKDKNGTVYYTTKLKIDTGGNITERFKRDVTGKVIEITRSVYEDGVCIFESITDGSNKILRKMKAVVDADGNVKSVRIFNDKEDLLYSKFKYFDFDEFDNWTKKVEYDKSGKAVRITKRHFMYFGKSY